MSTGKERLPPVEKETSDQKLFPSVVTGGFRQSASTGNSSKTFEYLNDKWHGRFRIVLFSAHISYGKGKYLNQTGFFFFFFFLQNLPRFYLYLNLRVLPIEFNPHKFSFVRYVFVEIFEVFLKNDENDENDPLMTK